ncbi:MAG: GntR family transcriptional regulator [Oceanicola sp.]|jgi:DNA-binding GntR family transcriptional regulator|nr:GntR family transcriptional regulator [Oceanicola sp.]
MDAITESSKSSVDGIIAALTEAVHEHRLQPGTKLREDEVCALFGVSRTIVRQALRSMAQEGLLTIRKNKGAMVSQPSLKEAHEVFQARALLEPSTARAAAQRASPEDIARLNAHIENEHAAVDRGEAGLALKLSGDFHLEIARIADQQTIEAFLRQLISRSSLVIALYWRRRNALCESHAHHALVDALASGDGEAAEQLMKGHLLDLLSQLDLREREAGPATLREALKR